MLVSGLTALMLTVPGVAHSQVADPAAKASLSPEDQKTIDAFMAATKAYLAIEHDAPSQAKLKPTTDVAEIEKRRQALRQIVVAARPNAKRGDLFTPAVADLLRRLIAQTMDSSNGSKVRRSLQGAEPAAAIEAVQIAVNHDYPNQRGQPLQSAPPTMLQFLPVLPKGLEYRMVGDILVLRDTEANLVVDFLPKALK
ncbi:MAG TPA: hypothetical protein VGN01_18010 [Acidobacteriaceae bacterium]|jgi:hypothetical protein